MFDVGGEKFDFLVVLGFVVCVEEDSVDWDCEDNGFGEEEFGDFEVVDEELIGFVVEGEIEVGHFVEREVLEATAAGDDDICDLGAGDEGPVVFVRGSAPKLRINQV